jgi:hypothetical protein
MKISEVVHEYAAKRATTGLKALQPSMTENSAEACAEDYQPAWPPVQFAGFKCISPDAP